MRLSLTADASAAGGHQPAPPPPPLRSPEACAPSRSPATTSPTIPRNGRASRPAGAAWSGERWAVVQGNAQEGAAAPARLCVCVLLRSWWVCCCCGRATVCVAHHLHTRRGTRTSTQLLLLVHITTRHPSHLPPLPRLVDQRGIPVGPDRVWLSTSWVPGLAMSRALGDGVAHSVGVSSGGESRARAKLLPSWAAGGGRPLVWPWVEGASPGRSVVCAAGECVWSLVGGLLVEMAAGGTCCSRSRGRGTALRGARHLVLATFLPRSLASTCCLPQSRRPLWWTSAPRTSS